MTFVPSASKMAMFRREQSSVMSVAERVNDSCSYCLKCRMTLASFFVTASSLSRTGFSQAANSRARAININCFIMVLKTKSFFGDGYYGDGT